MVLDNNDLLTDVELVGQTLVVDHLHLLGRLDRDGARGDAVEVVVLDHESVRLRDLEARQRDVSEPVPVQHQLLHFVCLYLT